MLTVLNLPILFQMQILSKIVSKSFSATDWVAYFIIKIACNLGVFVTLSALEVTSLGNVIKKHLLLLCILQFLYILNLIKYMADKVHIYYS